MSQRVYGFGIKDGRGYGPYGTGYYHAEDGQDLPFGPNGEKLTADFDFRPGPKGYLQGRLPPVHMVAGSEILDEFWHATARAPRAFPGQHTYLDGLDFMGAGLGMMRRATPAPAVAQAATQAAAPNTQAASAAGSRLLAVSKKLANKKPKTAAKLASLGQKMIQRASAMKAAVKVNAAQVKAAAAAAQAPKPAAPISAAPALRASPGRVARPTAPARRVANRTRVSGDALQNHIDQSGGDGSGMTMTAQAISPDAIRQLLEWVNESSALASVGELADSIVNLGNQLPSTATDLAQQAQTLVDRCTNLIDNYPDTGDPSVIPQAAQIQRDAAVWTSQAQAVLSGAAPPAGAPAAPDPGAGGGGSSSSDGSFDPGSAGGGASADDGGGDPGSADDEGGAQAAESETLQRFRQSSGDWDPFEDDGSQDGGATDGGDPEASAPPSDDGSGDGAVPELSADSSDDGEVDPETAAILRFRQSGGAEDPLDAVTGLGPGDYQFQVVDLFNPLGAYQRTQEAAEAKDRAVVADFQAADVSKQPASQPKPSPEVAKKLALAQRRLQEAKQKEQAFKLAQIRALAAQVNAQKAQDPGTGDDTTHTTDQGATVMGSEKLRQKIRDNRAALLGDEEDLFTEAPGDIVTQGYQHQITDEPPDVIRRRASVHRGAAYLQDATYPPWGSSAGEEGGDMRPQQEVNVLGCGQSAHAHGLDVMGVAPQVVKRQLKQNAAAPRAGFIKKKTPGGKTIATLVVRNPNAHDHAASIKNAKEAAQRAISIGKKLAAALAKKTPASVKTTVHGLIARRDQGKAMHRGPHLSLAQMKQIASHAVKQGQATLKSADTHSKLVTGLKAQGQAAVANQRKTYGPSGKPGTRVTGDLAFDTACDTLNEHMTALAAESLADAVVDEVFGLAPPDPNDPGWLTDGTVDPNYVPGQGSTGGAPGSPSVDPSADPSGTGYGQTAGPPDYGLGPAPTVAPPLVPGQDYIPGSNYPIDEPLAFSGDLPAGAVLYDKSMKPLPWQGVGSLTRFFPASDNGDGKSNSGFQWGGGDPSIMDGWYWWWHGATAGTEYKHENAGNSLDNGYGSGNETMPRRQQESVNRNWGPLIGNPNGWTKGLRYDSAGDRWFWFYDEAPDWAKAPMDAARLNQAILDYKAQVTAAAADAAAQAAQDKLDQEQAAQLAKQQAAEDAATARRQQQEQTEAEHQAQVQSVADQTAAQEQEAADASAARQADIESAAYAAQAQADAEAERQSQLTQAEIDQKAMEEEAALEQRAMETEARLNAMAPPATPDDGGDPFADGGAADAQDSMNDPVEDVLGQLRGMHKIRLRRALRNE